MRRHCRHLEPSVVLRSTPSSAAARQVFTGNTDNHTPVTNILDTPVDARYVRFYPQSWNDKIAMRVEILGCYTNSRFSSLVRLLGMESGAIPDDSITASSIVNSYFEPYYARLNGFSSGSEGGWMPIFTGIGQWLQVDLGNMKHVTGTIIQGRQKAEQWVTSYKLQYSADEIIWKTYTGSDGSDKVFQGNTDMITPVTNLLDSPVDARYVRFYPQSWNGIQFAMRAEILGCNTNICQVPLGMESGAIPDGSITASSTKLNDYLPYYARLHGLSGYGCWVPRSSNIGEWLQVDLGEMKRVTGTVVQGQQWLYPQWVKSYKLQYSADGANWTTYNDSDGTEMVFTGNTDNTTPVTNLLDTPIDARYVRFYPQSWQGAISLRVEILGCCIDMCPIPGYVSFNRVCYKAFTESKNYVGARQRCAEDGALLAMPKDNATIAFIHDFVDSETRWIGLTDIETDGQWVFEDGQTLESSGFSNWRTNEPSGGTVENCAAIYGPENLWIDATCNIFRGFICQLGGCVAPPTQANTIGPVCDCPYLLGESCTYPCSPGYNVTSGDVITRTCTSNGSWTEPDLFCHPEACYNFHYNYNACYNFHYNYNACYNFHYKYNACYNFHYNLNACYNFHYNYNACYNAHYNYNVSTYYNSLELDGESSDYLDDEVSTENISPTTTLPTLPTSTTQPPALLTTQEWSTQPTFLIEVIGEMRDLMQLLDAAADRLLEEAPPEGEITYFRSDGVMTAVKKDIPDVGVVPIGQDVGSVVFTKEDNLPEGSTMKVLAFVKDPFVWSVEKTEVSSSIVMVTITKDTDDVGGSPSNITVIVKQKVQFGITSDTEQQYHDTLPTSYRQNLADAGSSSFPLSKVPDVTDMTYHAVYISDEGQVPLIRFTIDDVDSELQVYFRFHDFPTEEEFDYTITVKPPEVTDHDGFEMPYGLVYSSFNTSLVPEIQKERGWIFVGVKRKGGDLPQTGLRRLLTSAVRATAPPADSAGFVLQSAVVSCLLREMDNHTWDSRTCKNQVAMSTAVADSSALGQAATFATASPRLATVVPSVSTIPSEVPGAEYVYVVCVRTGTQPDAGTASVVGLMVTGADGRTPMVTLNPDGLVLARGGDTYHIMSTPSSIGQIQSVQVWHDGSGKGNMESLFIDNIKVWDIQTSQGFYFPCNAWLSSSKGDGRTIRTMTAAPVGEMWMSEYTLPTFSYLLYDDHLLLSAVCNSGVRHFSRAQRMVCCLTQITLWMVGSAMWYGFKLGAGDVVLLDAGFVTFRLSELAGVAATSFTVFLPVYAILVPIFCTQHPLVDQIPSGLYETPTSPSTWRFPLKTVAWILAILTSVSSSLFVIVYSLQFGAERSQAWLKDLSWPSCSLHSYWSLFRSIFLIAYIKAVIVGPIVGTVTVCVRGGFGKNLSGKEERPPLGDIQRKIRGYDVPARRVLPPAPKKTDHDPNWNERMTQGRNILVLLVLMLIFTGNAFYIGVLGFDKHTYYVRTSLENSLLSGYDEVTTADSAWEWLSSDLMPSLHPERGYNGKTLRWLDKQFPDGTNAFRIGPVRLERTTEYKENPIDIDLEHSGQKLYPELQMFLQSKAVGRQNGRNCSHNGTTSIVNEVRNSTSACITTVDLPQDADQAAAVIDFLKHTHWILLVSDTLILRINFYHPDVKLFSTVDITLQYLPGGAGEIQPTIHTFRLFQYETAHDFVQMIFHIVFVLVYIYNLLTEILNVQKSCRLYFGSFWNILNLCNVGMSTAVIVTFALRYIQTAAVLDDILQAKGLLGIHEFVDISAASQWDATFKAVLSFSIFISTVSILRVLNFSRGVATIYALPRLIYGEAFGFSVYMLVVIVAYSFSGILIFGKNIESFSGFKKTSYVLFEMGLGRPFVGVFADDMKEVDRVMGPLYYSTFVIIFIFYLMNLGVGMLCNWLSYCQTSEDIDVDTAMGDYFWNSIRSLLGIRHESQDADDDEALPDHFVNETLQRTDTVLQEVDLLTDVMYRFECKKRGGRWKMLHYCAAKFFAPVMTVIFEDKEQLKVYVVSDLAIKQNQVTLQVQLRTWSSFTPLQNWTAAFDMVASSAKMVFNDATAQLLKTGKCASRKNCYFTSAMYLNKSRPFGPTNVHFLTPFQSANGLKKAKITVSNVTVLPEPSKAGAGTTLRLELQTTAPAPFVWLDAGDVAGRFSDNGFFMNIDRVSLEFYERSIVTVAAFQNEVTVHSLLNIYRNSV
ncbi:PREDICTED: LOW QUALITY PROTEIN: uncharacterized protein LOC109462448 [Branchiostoma belcheri]|uniref:Mannanase n=1 Tax=Branchiostoma belcheri TaxID=7741 RepID=A0A6P4Y736_BRABE|nr:PREDICTED: LOW QUALITY PROTEIN: uncharacterized protein LOC109462448 [Branchiostoma belcheri]